MTSRALVLGGGGLVGIAYESGLLHALAASGLDLSTADLVFGTSAGSVVGALARMGEPPAAAIELLGAAAADQPPAAPEAMATFYGELVAAVTQATSPEEARRRLGGVAVRSATVPEDDYVAMFSAVNGRAWPEGFACTAVDVETGEPKVWSAADGVPLDRAVASSCAVPAIFPPVTIQGRRWMDGGMRTSLNAGLATGHTLVLAISCFALELPPGLADPVIEGLNAEITAELDSLRAAGAAVEVVVPGPEMLDASGWGLELMNADRVAAGWEAGLADAERVRDRLAAAWKQA